MKTFPYKYLTLDTRTVEQLQSIYGHELDRLTVMEINNQLVEEFKDVV